jgi:hypothetical protein
MINLHIHPYPRPLGDNIDSIFLGHMMSKIENTKVNIRSGSHDLQLLSKIVNFGNVSLNQPHTGKVTNEYYNINEIKYYLNYSLKFETIPINPIVDNNLLLPEKYVTAQWDAGQLYRKVDRWDSNRINKIESFYKDQGFNIIHIGGQGKYKKLDDIVKIISKAKYHIGADSGMMHIAKFLIPIENIHVYINIRNRYDDVRFPDNWNVAFMAREIFRRGARMNYCENPSSDEIEYFKKVDLWA